MKKLFLFTFLYLACTLVYGQHRIRTDMMMLMQMRIPIQPDDKSWVNWNIIQSLQDSTKSVRIDRMAQGYAPFIPREDAPYYTSSQVKEIQLSLEKIMNPDGYFSTQEEYMVYSRAFLDKYVFRRESGD